MVYIVHLSGSIVDAFTVIIVFVVGVAVAVVIVIAAASV
jgi:hypothetical protein